MAGLVHASVSSERAVARHRAFICAHLVAGISTLAVLPIYLAMRGAPTVPEAMAFLALLLPLFVAFDLSRRGDLVRAHTLSACSIGLLVLPIAFATGGIASFAVPWLVIVPLEAAFASSRRAILAAIACALGVAVTLVGAQFMGILPVSPLSASTAHMMLVFGVGSAAVYATILAIRANAIGYEAIESTRRGEARYRLLAEYMHDLITRHTRSGNVTFVSPAAERLVGVEPGALMGQGLFDRVHVSDRPSYLTALSKVAAGEDESMVRFRLRRDHAKAGSSWVWVEMRCHAIEVDLSDRGRMERHVVSVTRDIEQRVAHETELLAAREEADRASMAKTHFLANISHELRTPLNAIIGFSEILATPELARMDTARQTEYATLIHESGLHLLAVVNSILDMSRIESGNFSIVPEPFELAPLMDTCRQLFTLKAEQANVSLTVDIPESIPEVVGDRRACRQIFINLLSNALKFTPSEGSVTVTARKDGGFVAISVADTGIGIAPGEVERLGEPFYQARASYDRPYEGTGLGLSVVKGLVNLHGGLFGIESTQGKGTVVTIHLPMEAAVEQTDSDMGAMIADAVQPARLSA